MRVNKFRAWNIEKKIMVYDNEDNSEDYLDGVYSTDVNLINSFLNRTGSFKIYDYMQYIGIEDIKGREIYEGDIIEYNHEAVGRIRRVVRMKYGMWGIEGNKEGTQIPFANICNCEYEVIGNIYENEDLLKVD